MNHDLDKLSADDLLTALAAGDLDEVDPGVAARFAADPALRARWRGTKAALDRLDEIGTVHREALADASVAELALPPLARRHRMWPLAAAAAAILIVIAAFAMRSELDPGPDPRLGAGTIVLSPDGERWQPGAPLRWTPLGGADAYRLEIEDVASPLRLTVPGPGFDALRVTSSEWTPSPAEIARLPLRLRWRVTAFDSSNDLIGASRWAETTR